MERYNLVTGGSYERSQKLVAPVPRKLERISMVDG